ncbi:MAG: SseB family protein [Rhodocyclaceae bacterium]|nr:SseB family protein [Rhodocyclaceae bacterium]
MPDSDLDPKNELERLLLAAMTGEMSSEEFMQALLGQQVFIPVRDDDKDPGIAGFQRTTKATPLIVEDEDGQRILVLFTSPERAKAFLADTPGYGGGLLTDFSWIVERMEPGFAIVVNPGLDFGIDIAPENVTEMLGLLAERAAKN